MRVLQVVPMYPGGAHDGSALFHRALNRALLEQGVRISVVCTRTERIEPVLPFLIKWPNQLAARALEDGIPVRRFRCVDMGRAGARLSDAVVRRWSREDVSDGRLLDGSARFAESAVRQARRRPSRFDLCADLGRGPVSPALVAHVARVAPRFDVILTGYAPLFMPRMVMRAARLSGAPVVLLPFIHETDRYHHFASLYDAYAGASAVLTLSRHTADFLHRCIPGCRAIAIGAGAGDEPAVVDRSKKIDAFRARHDLHDQRLLLFVGRKEPGKRYDLAIEAVERLPEDVTLVMVGRDVDGRPLKSPRVRYLGAVSDDELATAHAASEVFVFPSQHESFGMVFLDAWRHGKPVIGNAGCGAAAALIDDGKDGYLRRDGPGIAAAVQGLLDDPRKAAELGAAGLAKTLATYTWTHVASRVRATLEAVSSASRTRPWPPRAGA